MFIRLQTVFIYVFISDQNVNIYIYIFILIINKYICYDLKQTPEVRLCDEAGLINVFKQSPLNE